MYKKFPILYKKNSTGSIQYWSITTVEELANNHLTVKLIVEFGQVGTDNPQGTVYIIDTGKNIGKKNETSIYEQADKDAQSKWDSQKKNGYVESEDLAQQEKLDSVIEGGILPMLAHDFSNHGHKIKFPCYAQPKLDGIRCVAIINNGICTLWSRTRKPIMSMDHIVKELQNIFADENIILDGEIYNHELKHNFETIVSIVRKKSADQDCRMVEYHIYDIISDDKFQIRNEFLIKRFNNLKEDSCIKLVPTEIVVEENEIIHYFNSFAKEGYEGAILRNRNGLYVHRRSYDLQKVKKFLDDEFSIVGINEGNGSLIGHVGSFVCETDDGKQFFVKMSGNVEKLKDYFDDHSLWANKKLTVKYQGLTSYGIPRFPVGLRIRECE